MHHTAFEWLQALGGAALFLCVGWAFAGAITWAVHFLSGWMLSWLFLGHGARGDYYRVWLEKDEAREAIIRCRASSRGSEQGR